MAGSARSRVLTVLDICSPLIRCFCSRMSYSATLASLSHEWWMEYIVFGLPCLVECCLCWHFWWAPNEIINQRNTWKQVGITSSLGDWQNLTETSFLRKAPICRSFVAPPWTTLCSQTQDDTSVVCRLHRVWRLGCWDTQGTIPSEIVFP